MNKLAFALAALTLASPALAQEPAGAQRDACLPGSQIVAETGACPELGEAPSHDQTRGDFGHGTRPLSLSEAEWNGEDD